MRHELTLAMIFFVSCTSAGKKYFVSASGDDDNPGTSAQPFQTIQKVNTLTLSPGDAVFFKGGEEFPGTLSLTLNGTEQDSVVIGSYGDGRAVINGGNGLAATLRGKYFSFGNIDAKGSGRKEGNTSAGIQLVETSHALLENIRAEGFQKSGVGLWNCNNMLIQKVTAENNGFAGIYVQGTGKKKSSHIVLRDCAANNNPGDPTNLDNHSGNGILVALSTDVLVDRCTATGNGWDMPRIGNGPVGIWTFESDSVIIQHCISYRNRTREGAKDGGGFDLDGGVTNSIIQYCLSYENDGAGYGLFQYDGASSWRNNIMRYCVSINDAQKTNGSGGIFIWSNDDDPKGLSKCYVYNNLIYNTGSAAVEFEPQSVNSEFFFCNNIFIAKNNLVNGPSSGEKFLGNVWWPLEKGAPFRNYNSLENWARATGQEMGNGKPAGLQTDPLLKGPLEISATNPYQLEKLTAFQLQPSSPLKNKGMNVAAEFNLKKAETDFYGNNIQGSEHPEPGVYEMGE
jgi:hypothetical protein